MTDRLRQLVEAADPAGSLTLSVSWLREQLGEAGDPQPNSTVVESWRTLIWTAPHDTLLGVHEIGEAVGRPVSWVYRRTGPAAGDRLPVMRLAGEVVCRADDLRSWIRRHLEPGETPRRRLRAG